MQYQILFDSELLSEFVEVEEDTLLTKSNLGIFGVLGVFGF